MTTNDLTTMPLGQLLRRAGLISDSQLDHALQVQKSRGQALGRILVDLGYISDRDLANALSDQYGLEFVPFPDEGFQPAAARLVDESFVQKQLAIPLRAEGNEILLGMVYPGNLWALDHVAALSRRTVTPVVITEQALERLSLITFRLDDASLRAAPAQQQPQPVQSPDKEHAGVVRLVSDLMDQAITLGASDIHLEPLGAALRVRYRVDGLLTEAMRLPAHLAASLVSRIKVMAGMDIAERRLPQDGRFELEAGPVCDFRVATVPTVHGERVTIRLFDHAAGVRNLASLGLDAADAALLRQMAFRAHGMLLVTGPTGSGKTTTLAAVLAELNQVERHVITIEDPVEYQLPGVMQVQVNPKAGLTFATGLRSLLRHDPDVIMVGEIRDTETAELAVRAALTGHFVLSTLHTTSAAGAVTRLIDMGVEPYLVESAVSGIVAQRLVRRLCPRCKVSGAPDPRSPLLKRYGSLLQGEQTYRPAGCNYCDGKGYRGRVGIFEMLPVTEELAQLIRPGISAGMVDSAARAGGMRTLLESGLHKVAVGETSLEEVQRVVLGAL